MAGHAGSSHAVKSRQGCSTIRSISYKQALVNPAPVAAPVVSLASTPGSSPKIIALREACLDYGCKIPPRTSKRGCVFHFLDKVGELVVGTVLSTEDQAALSAFTQHLTKAGASKEHKVTAHLAQAARHLKAAVELDMRPAENDAVLPTVSYSQSMSDDEDHKERLTQRIFGAEPSDSVPQTDEGEECREELTQRLFGREHVSNSFTRRQEIDELEENRMELSQRLFGRDHVSTSFGRSDAAVIAAVTGAQSSRGLHSPGSGEWLS